MSILKRLDTNNIVKPKEYFINDFSNESIKDISNNIIEIEKSFYDMENYVTYYDVETNKNNVKLSVIGYCHNIRVNKKMIFVVLRYKESTLQLIVFKKSYPNVFQILKDLKFESTIKASGKIVKADVTGCSVTEYELRLSDVEVISSAQEIPFSLDDANETFHVDNSEKMLEKEKEDEEVDISKELKESKEVRRCRIGRYTRLDNRWLDLRTIVNQKIFRLRSRLENTLRGQLLQINFIEIHTPKIIPAVSESGSNVFDVTYFGKNLYLAQSPQLYKQMLINSGFDRVYEFGPVFRAENANTYRHLCEFTSFDMEFTIKPNEDHITIIKLIWKVLYKTFSILNKNFTDDIDYILEKTNTYKLIFPKNPVIIDYKEGVKLLNESGIIQESLEDIGTVNEKKLGKLIKEKYNTDVYVLSGFPNKTRPFYTMKQDEKYSRSFDFMMRGNEISSGAQRNHDPSILKQAIKEHGIILDGTSGLEDYVKSFEIGSLPHGGCGIGVERLLMFFLGLHNIRTTTLFPRDPKRITP